MASPRSISTGNGRDIVKKGYTKSRYSTAVITSSFDFLSRLLLACRTYVYYNKKLLWQHKSRDLYDALGALHSNLCNDIPGCTAKSDRTVRGHPDRSRSSLSLDPDAKHCRSELKSDAELKKKTSRSGGWHPGNQAGCRSNRLSLDITCASIAMETQCLPNCTMASCNANMQASTACQPACAVPAQVAQTVQSPVPPQGMPPSGRPPTHHSTDS